LPINSHKKLFYLRDGQIVEMFLVNNDDYGLKIYDSNLSITSTFYSRHCIELLDNNLAMTVRRNKANEYPVDLIIYNPSTRVEKTISLGIIEYAPMMQFSIDTLIIVNKFGHSNHPFGIYLINLLTYTQTIIEIPSASPSGINIGIKLSVDRLALLSYDDFGIIYIVNLAFNKFEKIINLRLRDEFKNHSITFKSNLSDGRLVYRVNSSHKENLNCIVIINLITEDSIVINESKHFIENLRWGTLISSSIVELKYCTNRIAVCKGDEQVKIYDITSGSCDSVLIHPEGSIIKCLLVLLDGRLLTVDFETDSLYIWDLNNTETWLRKLSLDLRNRVGLDYCPTESPDGSLAIVVNNYSSFIRIWKRRLS